jgi:methyl-accepting chemotaxis protein
VNKQRKKIWIDRFQTHLFVRIAFQCFVFQVAIWLLVFIGLQIQAGLSALIGPTGPSLFFGFAAIVAVLLTVLFIYDIVRLAHRLVGPLVRFRHAMRAITAGDEVELLKLRQGDYLGEMRDEFNAMLEALEQRGAVVLKTPAPTAGQQPAVEQQQAVTV